MKQRGVYEDALGIDSRATVAANNLAWILAESGEDLNRALELAKIAIASSPDVPEILDTLGWVYYKKDQPDLAIPIFRRAIAKAADNPNYHYHLGLALLKSGDLTNGRPELQRAHVRRRGNGDRDSTSIGFEVTASAVAVAARRSLFARRGRVAGSWWFLGSRINAVLAATFCNRRAFRICAVWRLTHRVALCLCLGAVACGGDDDRPSGDPVPVRGNQRLGWDQTAASVEALRAHTFNLHIDDNLATFVDPRCTETRTHADTSVRAVCCLCQPDVT